MSRSSFHLPCRLSCLAFISQMPAIRRSASEGAHPDASPDYQKLRHNGFLKKQQQQAANISTVVLSGGITRLATFPYPLTLSGKPVVPSQVARTLRSSHSPTPTCFCLEPAKYVNPIVNGQFAGKHAFACKTRSCSYWGPFFLVFLHSFPEVDCFQSSLMTSWPTCDPQNDNSDPFGAGVSTSGNLFTTGSAHTNRIKMESPSPLPLMSANAIKSSAAGSPSSSFASSSSVSSAGIGPMYGAKYLPKPMRPLPGDTRLDLWSPPPPILCAESHKTTKTRKSAPEIDLLTSSTGLNVEEFWSLWDYCPVCRTILCAFFIPFHVCDLSGDE
ncbi:hypothetical protein B0H14DRAFT_3579562 [Mycena olivaceomarginata]|nr:hypothetical protein B0H14DRAFT_3579562 [Mycena olivaceomarginata]